MGDPQERLKQLPRDLWKTAGYGANEATKITDTIIHQFREKGLKDCLDRFNLFLGQRGIGYLVDPSQSRKSLNNKDLLTLAKAARQQINSVNEERKQINAAVLVHPLASNELDSC